MWCGSTARRGPDRTDDHSVARRRMAASRRLPGLCRGSARRAGGARTRSGQLGRRRRRRRALSRRLARADSPTDGIAVNATGRTPVCILAYQPDGGCICLYRSRSADDRLTLTRRNSVSLPPPTGSASRSARAGADGSLAHGARPEPRSSGPSRTIRARCPSDLAAALAARADRRLHASRGEAAFVADALAAASTAASADPASRRAARRAPLIAGRREARRSSRADAADDPTGAGDTFVGGFLAALA